MTYPIMRIPSVEEVIVCLFFDKDCKNYTVRSYWLDSNPRYDKVVSSAWNHKGPKKDLMFYLFTKILKQDFPSRETESEPT